MNRYLALLFLFLLIFGSASGQVFRYRLSANTGIFLGEPGKAEINHPMKDELSYAGSQNFKPTLMPGAELEIMAPVSPDFEWGLQFGFTNLAGYTPQAPLYNFFLSRNNPLPDTYKYPTETLIFDTKLFSIQATARWHFLPILGEVNIFMKFLGGVTFTGTDFTFKDPHYSIKYDVGVLFARGTQNSDYPKYAAISGGAGLGATYRISNKLDVYFDLTASLINSDIVNGVPNYNFVNNQGQTSMQRTNSLSSVAQANLGLLYSAIPDRRFNKSNFTRSNRMNKNTFLKKNRSKPFTKGRKR